MRRWLAPLALGLFAALLAWHVTLANFPLVLMRLAVARVASVGGVNRMTHAPLATAASRAIVRPSPDLFYSSCPYDLSAGPVLLEAAPVPAPYWSVSVFDAKTNAVFVGHAARPVRLALVTGAQVAPAGFTPVRVEGRRGIALVRILVNRAAPLDAIDAARRTGRCWPVRG